MADTTDTRYNGRVKWFNKKSGFGFITISEGDRVDTDVFVHHSNLNVTEEQYRYLVQGEYVSFTLGTTEGGDHEFQAINVSGVFGGTLMCETHREVRNARIQRAKELGLSNEGDDAGMGRGRGGRGRGGGRGERGRGRGRGATRPSTTTDESQTQA